MNKLKAFVLAMTMVMGFAVVSEGQGFFFSSTARMLRLANNVFFVGRNQANNGDVNMFKVNTSNIIESGGPVSFGTNPAGAGTILRVPNNTNVITSRNAANNGDIQFVFIDTNNLWNIDPGASGILYTAKAFASLGTPANGAFYYCNDCTLASPCAGAGTGAFAKRLNGIWVCN